MRLIRSLLTSLIIGDKFNKELIPSLNKMNPIRIFKIIVLCCWVIMAGLLTACDSGVVLPTLINDAETYRKYLVHYDPDNIKKEQWDDPEILKTPRVQFTWTEPHLNPRDISHTALWSMKLDGTDLRLVASPEELMPEHLEQSRFRGEVSFVRSPDNRYVAYAMAHGAKAERRLLDLKTKQVIVMAKGYGPPQFMWFKGGRYLTFSGPGTLNQFDMVTHETKEIGLRRFGKNYIHRALAYDNGNQMVDAQDGVATFYDFDTGKVLREIPNDYGILTLDGKHWIKYVKGHQIYATPLEEPFKKVLEYPKGVVNSPMEVISADGVVMSGGIIIAKTGDDKVKIYSLPGKGDIENTSLYNTALFLNTMQSTTAKH